MNQFRRFPFLLLAATPPAGGNGPKTPAPAPASPPPAAAPAPEEPPLTPEQLAAIEAQKEAEAKARFAAAQKKTTDKCLVAVELVQKARKEAEKLREQIKAIDIAAGDLEGSVTTARDVNRQDPVRAITHLEESLKAFQTAAMKFPELK